MQFHAKPAATIVLATAALTFGLVSGLVTQKGGIPLGGVRVVNLTTSESTLTNENGAWSLGTPPVNAQPKRTSSIRFLPGNLLRIQVPTAGVLNIRAFGIDGKKLLEADHLCRPGTNDIPVARLSRTVSHLRIRIGDQTTVIPWGNSGADRSIETGVATRGLGIDLFDFTLTGYHRVTRALVAGEQDTLLVTMNPIDNDSDGVANFIDNCLSASNSDQRDWDWDGKGDACDNSDADTLLDAVDPCPVDPTSTCLRTGDKDADGIQDPFDNCPTVFNPILRGLTQEDADENGIGDRCDTTSPQTLTDRRGGSGYLGFTAYRTTKIGNQLWMAENLVHPIAGGGSHCYRDSAKFCMTYGLLYSWSAAQKACPTGWHLPSPAEWDTLMAFVGKDSAGPRLRTTYGWSKDGNGTDDFSFSAFPSGMRWGPAGGTPRDSFAGSGSRYWSTGIVSQTSVKATSVFLSVTSGVSLWPKLNVASTDTTGHAYSVRCIKD